ncbi:hypothetical protein Poli38472_011145 [Pythium oligandrum]|uniref:Uncharacterized protein n=1 Tax=Pythium oligandrum TaxID=41045 RepID=A0A8K1CQ84_PYTOL|nr:hypothetical protein Poli38472_011145 [Pythium oligandrum]|eukprot:TMW67525.1 hypothetical protein Poli38472_011145 [Pythium oligandrum]
MKTCVFLAIAATLAVAVSAANVNIRGAQRDEAPASTDIRIRTTDVLNRSTGLLNKNRVAMDNNVNIARSNVLFSQNDRLAMAKQVEQALNAEEQDGTAVTLTRSVMRSVSAPDTDSSLMTKASAVVAAKGGDASTLSQRIADFVNAVDDKKEQSIQSETPRGMQLSVGTKDILRQPTAVINKNVGMSDNQITMSRTTFAPLRNDRVTMSNNAKVANAVVPGSAIRVDQITAREGQDQDDASSEEMRVPDDKKEQFGWGWGFPGYGWGGFW